MPIVAGPPTIVASPEEAALATEARRLLAFAAPSRHRLGFSRLDTHGRPRLDLPVETWLSARMTHCFTVGAQLGEPGCAELADHGIETLLHRLSDARYGGWHSAVDADGLPVTARKEAYAHSFVVLAGASGVAAGRPGAPELLSMALETLETRFWEWGRGTHSESFARDWTDGEAYRGTNSNMHCAVALLAAADATGDSRWRDRALETADRLINRVARSREWRTVEHFDPQWREVLGYNADDKSSAFRPYGLTLGHWFEWSRLLLSLESSLERPPAWLREGAIALFDGAVRVGWAADGEPGFPYTVDWDLKPVVRTRMQWVVSEAIAAAAALHQCTGETRYAGHYRQWWSYTERHFVDQVHGSWHHELDEHNRPSAFVWAGKPDIYHSLQATLLPRLPIGSSLAGALRDGLLDTVRPPLHTGTAGDQQE